MTDHTIVNPFSLNQTMSKLDVQRKYFHKTPLAIQLFKLLTEEQRVLILTDPNPEVRDLYNLIEADFEKVEKIRRILEEVKNK